MPRWRPRTPEPPPVVIERIEPVEIPILTETKRLVARGEYDRALREAYAQVITDVQRAYGQPFAPGWTTGEILARGTTEPMGHLREFLARLTELYAPLRFHPEGADRRPEELLEVLRSIYAARPMWRLYLEPRDDATPAAPPVAEGTRPPEEP